MKILWLKTELLHPVDKGGRIRTYQMLRELKKEHEITYLTLDDGTAAADARELAAEYCSELITVPHQVAPKFSPRFYGELAGNLFSKLPYFIAKYRSPAMQQAIETTVADGRHDILVCDFLHPAINLPQKSIGIPTLLFQHNVEAMIWRRHYEVAESMPKKAYLKSQWERARRFERQACRRFDTVVAVSKEDGEVFRSEYGHKRVKEIGTGVDTEYFTPVNGDRTTKPNIVFTGSMDWLPNSDAVMWFTKEIFPRIKQEIPEATFTVVGRDPFPEILELAKRDPSIKVTGRVDDVRPYMREAAVFVVPIRIGGGTRLKIFEAMAMGLPVVSTTIGAEGLPVTDGKDILLRDDPPTFSQAIVSLFVDLEYAAGLSESGSNIVRRRFAWHRIAKQFSDIADNTLTVGKAKTAHQVAAFEPKATAGKSFHSA
ncbi:MAG: glycosyltransferase [Acidobacteria bacterium]|nr:glycosyltransferase [Acidobacteriota bacterium]